MAPCPKCSKMVSKTKTGRIEGHADRFGMCSGSFGSATFQVKGAK